MLENRTAVDLELTAMRKENILRTFRLGTGREDWGIMSTEHYLRVVSETSFFALCFFCFLAKVSSMQLEARSIM